MSMIVETDHGTPPSPLVETVTLTIDGAPVSVPAGTSIMRAASLAGSAIPKLCATDTMAAYGSCRVCLVEIEGRGGTPASCTTPVAEGMVVQTQSERIQKLRRGVMELYASDHPMAALDGLEANTEFREVIDAVGLTEMRYSAQASHLDCPQDVSNPYFAFDPAKCIVCSRCVRACDEIQGTFALTISGRGFQAHVSASQDEPFLQSECVSCGACVQACPTGALQEKAIAEVGQPEHSVVTTCAYCGVGCAF